MYSFTKTRTLLVGNHSSSIIVLRIFTVIFLTFLFILSCQQKTNQNTAKYDSVPSSDGVSIHYLIKGEGSPALVFVHGWSCDKSYWENQIDFFAQNHKVVAIDLGAHGKSGLNREYWTIQAFGEDVRAVVNKLGLKKMVLIGHSMGGAVVLEAARGLSDRVIALVGADTFQDFVNEYSDMQKENYLTPFEANFSQTADKFVRSMFHPTADSSLVNKIAADMSAAPPKAAVGAMRYYFYYNIKETLKEVRIPIYCINSDKYPTNIDGNRQHAVSFEVLFMPGVGHFVMMEDAEKFNKLLTEILDKIQNAAS